MPIPTHLLERAYQLINANQLQNAELVLDAVVRVDPQNVDAWKTYLQIHQNQTDLDWLKERVLKTKELSEAAKTELFNYHLFLTEQISSPKEAINWADTSNALALERKEDTAITDETPIRFELIDVFDYPARIVKNETRSKPRQRVTYSSIIFDIAKGALEEINDTPFGKRIAAYIKQAITLANNLIKNPKDAYAMISKSPDFEKSIGITLLVLFVLGIRLIVFSHFFGYIFLGIFIIGSGWWLANFGSHNTTQYRMYLHDNKINLPTIREVEPEQEQEQEQESDD